MTEPDPPTSVEILQQLIRFDTSNPPGNEAECISYINHLLTGAGIETKILARDPNRPNLIARLPGSGQAAPRLLYGHVDVVTTAGQSWTYPPFAAEIHNGYVWGRGALDMKGAVAMMITAVLRAKAEDTALPGEVILAVLSDEEAGGDYGAKFLVDKHPVEFEGVRYALGETGGFNLQVGPLRFYPVMVAEKRMCWMKATVRGPGGHGSMPVQGGAMAKLGRMLRRLDRGSLPVHITPVVQAMLDHMATALSGAPGMLIRQLTNPRLTNRVLGLLGPRGAMFKPMLHNTVSPTIVRGGDKINVIPSEITVELDGRLLPGSTPEDMFTELNHLLRGEVELELLRYDPGPAEPDMSQLTILGDILCQADPQGIPIPLLLSGVTDGRFFSRLGIQTYGFTPMQLPADFNFIRSIHGTDERLPVEAVDFGSRAIFKAIQRLGV